MRHTHIAWWTALDAVGNRRPWGDGSGTPSFAYDDADQLTSVTPPGQQAIEYTWDDNGNLLQRGADTYDWNAGDKLTEASVASVTTDMVYNGDGVRDSRIVGEDTVTFTWDVARSIPQVIDDGSLAYVYGLGRVSRVGASDTFYYLSDGLSSTMALTDADGDVVNTYDYDVFGAVSAQTGSQPNEFQFTGEQMDDTTSLGYLRARHYDPAIGRFLSQDALSAGNLYAYVANNPLLYVDPTGQLLGIPCPGCGKAADALGDVADKAGDLRECVGNVPGCAKNAVEDYVVAPILEYTGHEGAANCVRGSGAERCVAGWVAQQALKVLGGEKGYIDLNATGCLGLCLAFGLQYRSGQGVHGYVGSGVGLGGGVSVTVAPWQDVTTRWNCGVQVSYLAGTAQGGVSGFGFDERGRYTQGAIGEVGLGWEAGGSYTCVHIW